MAQTVLITSRPAHQRERLMNPALSLNQCG